MAAHKAWWDSRSRIRGFCSRFGILSALRLAGAESLESKLPILSLNWAFQGTTSSCQVATSLLGSMYGEKVKQIVRRWQRFACSGGYSTALEPNAAVAARMHRQWKTRECSHNAGEADNDGAVVVPEGSLAVFVGRERRRYILCDQYVNHPLFKSLLAKAAKAQLGSADAASASPEGISIPCEVVLFEHLLWILRNDDSAIRESVDELVEFYACS